MKRHFYFVLLRILSIPALPVMYLQGKRIKSTIPDLPEAKKPQGATSNGYQRKISLLGIGESTIAGVGVSFHKNGMISHLSESLADLIKKNIDWKIYARSGFTASELTKVLIPKMIDEQPDLIIVGLGGNNAFNLQSPLKWEQEIKTLIEKLQDYFPSSPIVFTNMPPIKEFPAFTSLLQVTIGNLVEALGRSLSDVVDQYENVYYNEEVITIEKWKKRLKIAGDSKLFFSDGVHPSAFTYSVWGKEMARFIYENGIVK